MYSIRFHVSTLVLMSLPFASVDVALAQTTMQVPAVPGCAKDIECKGDRICIEGACVFPSEVEAEAIEEKEPELSIEDVDFMDFYVSIGWCFPAVMIMAWDDTNDEPDDGAVTLFPFNIRLSAHHVVSDVAHIGGFLSYQNFPINDDVNSYSSMVLGMSTRVGMRVAAKTWMGLNFDIGMSVYRNALKNAGQKNEIKTDDVSLFLYPAVALVHQFGTNGLRGGVEAMLGLEVYAGDQASVEDTGNYRHVSLGPAIRLGFLMGGEL